MNIFVLDRDPVLAAKMLCNTHVVKMLLESCQLLSTHDRLTGRWEDPSQLYKPTHINHPCRVCLDNEHNRIWLIRHLHALLFEYTYRYGKVHKCNNLYQIYWFNDLKWMTKYGDKRYYYVNGEPFVVGAAQTFPKCMPDEFKVGGDGIDDVVQSYRNYYKYKQQTLKRFEYKRRTAPEWLT